MPETREQGAVPQGLIEQARARNIDPGKLQMLGKTAAALYSNDGVKLNDAVLRAIGPDDLGPEHTRRVCEFANQEAFQKEWEKGGSVRNIEFQGGPADPAVVLRELNDGARPEAVKLSSDYDYAPPKLAMDRRVEEEIFGKLASVTPDEVVPGGNDLAALRITANGAHDHIQSKIDGLEVTKEALALELGDVVGDMVLNGEPLSKIAHVWTHFTSDPTLFSRAVAAATSRMDSRKIEYSSEIDKTAAVGKIPNPAHPVVSRFIEFTKVAAEIDRLKMANNVIEEQLNRVNAAIRNL
jgi:hypothetical protein